MAKLLWRGGTVSPCVWLGIWAVHLHGWRKVAILPNARREGGRERGVGRARARERSSTRGRKTRTEKQAGHVYEKKSDRFNAVAAVRCLLIVEFKQFHSWLSYFGDFCWRIWWSVAQGLPLLLLLLLGTVLPSFLQLLLGIQYSDCVFLPMFSCFCSLVKCDCLQLNILCCFNLILCEDLCIVIQFI